MTVSLVVLTPGSTEGQVIPIDFPQFLIGRSPACHLRPASPMISKRHCALVRRGRKVIVRDFASTNGTFVNGKPVKYEVSLKHEDLLEVGPLLFSVHLRTTPEIERSVSLPPPRQTIPIDDEESAGNHLLTMLEEAPDNINSEKGDKINLESEEEKNNGMLLITSIVGQDSRNPSNAKKKEDDKKSSDAAHAILNKYLKRPRS